MVWKSSFRQNYRTTFSPTVPTSAAGISHVVANVETLGGEKWEHLKSGGKQWQATPKNLPRMQRTRAIPVAWLSSGLCPNRPKGWIPIIIIIMSVMYKVFSVAQWGWQQVRLCACKNVRSCTVTQRHGVVLNQAHGLHLYLFVVSLLYHHISILWTIIWFYKFIVCEWKPCFYLQVRVTVHH